jgi:hypothetical protein
MMMGVGQPVEWEFAGETEVLGETLSQYHFAHNKSYITRLGLEPGTPRLTVLAMGLSFVPK